MRYALALIAIIGVYCSGCAGPTESVVAKKPMNVIIILADDLGITDIGFFGSEIETPNIDALAQDSLVFTSFYASPNCSPSRAMLLTGKDHHSVGLGTMAGYWAENQIGQTGYEGYLNSSVPTLPEILGQYGYNNYMAGKWHLGKTQGHIPTDRGFDRSFVLLEGGASHFSDATPLVRGRKTTYLENGLETSIPEDFYSSDFYTDKIISYIDEGISVGTPFFAYLAFTAVHWPLQVPDEDLQTNVGMYDEGFSKIRDQRVENYKSLGFFPADAKVSTTPYVDDWALLSKQAQKTEARKMELYAGMVQRIDANIGRLVDYLRNAELYENTVIIFLSDNGPEGNNLNFLRDNASWLPEQFDNSFDNMGREGSYVFYGSNWAQVSATPYRNFKSFVSEGGVRVPAFIKHPMGRKGVTSEPAHITDIFPTILDVIGLEFGDRRPEIDSTLQFDGNSIDKILLNERSVSDGQTFEQGWELFGRRAYRNGNWKVVNQIPPYGNGEWELFDLQNDPGETNNLASDYPELVSELSQKWLHYAKRHNVVLPDQGESPYVINRKINRSSNR